MMKFNTKVALFASVVLLLLVVDFGTATSGCGCNTEPTGCVPCDKICNSNAPVGCSAACVSKPIFCKCKSGYCRPTGKSEGCVKIKRC